MPAQTRSRLGRLTISPQWASVAIREVGPGMYGGIRIVTATAITVAFGAIPLVLMSANSASAQSAGGVTDPVGRDGILVANSPQDGASPHPHPCGTDLSLPDILDRLPGPYEYEYPGPRGVRQCSSKLVQENRPSGQVIVPRMRCWWEVR